MQNAMGIKCAFGPAHSMRWWFENVTERNAHAKMFSQCDFLSTENIISSNAN